VIAAGPHLELRLNNLLNPVRPDFNHSLIVNLIRQRHAQDVLAWWHRIENHST